MDDDMNDRICDHRALLDRIHETYIQKNKAYGNSFDRSIERWGYTAALVRMEDKLNRLEQLLLNDAAQNDEAAEDTALDLANYSIMLAMIVLERKALRTMKLGQAPCFADIYKQCHVETNSLDNSVEK